MVEPLGSARYADFLALNGSAAGFSLGEGGTPLQPLDRLAERFFLPSVLAKNEAVNPTGSFKDRGTVTAVQQAAAFGFKAVGTVSTGNMAGSTAAYAARAGMGCVVCVKDGTPPSKILAAGVYGALVVKVRGDYAALFRRSFEIGKALGIGFLNSVDPWRIEGYKTASYEIFEQLGGRAPDYLFVPTSAGGHLVGLVRGFEDLKRAGLIRKLPAVVAAQAAGCAPIARAFARSRDITARFKNPRTIAHAISNPDPPAGRIVLRLLAATGGRAAAVSEAGILKAQRLLAETEGIFCDPASAVSLAAFMAMARRGEIPPGARSVLMITGSGLKTIEDLDPRRLKVIESRLDGLERALARV
ncbi:MAG: threonine synthase [Acidobacteriota bacterium]|nr:threonine synthase [Acidobacteriota bacterium]